MNALREGDWHWANSYDSGSVQVLLLLPMMIIMIMMIKFPMNDDVFYDAGDKPDQL